MTTDLLMYLSFYHSQNIINTDIQIIVISPLRHNTCPRLSTAISLYGTLKNESRDSIQLWKYDSIPTPMKVDITLTLL